METTPFFYPTIGEEDDIVLKHHEFLQDEQKSNSFLKHQVNIYRYLSPFTEYKRLFCLHACGTGKSGVSACLYENYSKLLGNNFVFIYLSNNTVTKSNFISEMVKLSPTFHKLYQFSTTKRNLGKNNVFIERYTRMDIQELLTKLKWKYTEGIPMIIIVDEAHHLILSKDTLDSEEDHNNPFEIREEMNKRLESLQLLLQTYPEAKQVLMTATPIRHDRKELIPLLNLLLDDNNKLQKNEFEQHDWRDTFKEKTKGMVSYFRNNIFENIIVEYQTGDSRFDHFNQDSYFKTCFHQMHPFQSDLYLKSLFNNTKREAKDDVYHNNYLHRHSIIVEFESFLREISIVSNVRQRIMILGKYSVIFSKIMNEILDHPAEKVFIYSKYINHAGLNLFIYILNLFQFIEYTPSLVIDPNRIYFIYLRPESSISSTILVDLFNTTPQIKLILSSEKNSESLTFKNIQQIHILQGWWNYGRMQQTLGRGLRYGSHFDITRHQTFHQLKEFLVTKLKTDEKMKEILAPILQKEFEKKRDRLKSNYYCLPPNDFQEVDDFIFDLISIMRKEEIEQLFNMKFAIEIRLKVYLHCALPDMDKYNEQYENTEIKKSSLDILQLKQYQQSNQREEKIREVIFELYQNSFDYHLNYENNKILSENDLYFPREYQEKEIPKKTPTDDRSKKNYHHLYLQETSEKLKNEILSFLKDNLGQTGIDLRMSLNDVLFYFQDYHYSDFELLDSLTEIFSEKTKIMTSMKEQYFLCFDDDEIYLSRQFRFNMMNLHGKPRDVLLHSSIRESISIEDYRKNDNHSFEEQIKHEDDIGEKRKLEYEEDEYEDKKQRKKRNKLVREIKNKVRMSISEIYESFVDERKRRRQPILYCADILHMGIFLFSFGDSTEIINQKEVNNKIKTRLCKTLSVSSVENEVWDETYTKLMSAINRTMMKPFFDRDWEIIINDIEERVQELQRRYMDDTFFLKFKKRLLDYHSLSSFGEEFVSMEKEDIEFHNHLEIAIWLDLQMMTFAVSTPLSNIKHNHSLHGMSESKLDLWNSFYNQYLRDKRLESYGRNIDSLTYEHLIKIYYVYIDEHEIESDHLKEELQFNYNVISNDPTKRLKMSKVMDHKMILQTLFRILRKQGRYLTFDEDGERISIIKDY